MGEYKIVVRDRELIPIGQIDDYIEFTATLKFCDTGQWTLKIQAGLPHARLLQPGCGIIVYRNGVEKPILSGPVQGIQKYWTIDTDSGPGALFVSGADDNYIMQSHVCYPDPSNPLDKQSTTSDTTTALTASHALQSVISRNSGSESLDSRKPFGYLTPTSVGTWKYDEYGPVTPYSLRFDNLRDAVKTIAEAGGIGWRNVYDPETRTIRLETFQVRDRTGMIRFSPDLGNLKEFVYSMTAPKVTRAIVAAQGEGKERFITSYIDKEAEDYWGVIAEQFVDARDVPLKKDKTGKPVLVGEVEAGTTVQSCLVTMGQRGQEVLSQNQSQGNMQVYPVDTPSLTFGVHWWLGDKVTCVVDGTVHQDIVRQVTISDSAEGSSITPNVGNQGTDAPTNVFGEIKALWRKVNQLSSRM
ncbi:MULTISPECIES: siphovirus ReqiPepy6 Gp37-like family protein [unclassified Streptomyces]|uniref:siphovirus ReqiPepy6 Gp37-like family protein n=1 Tax=unclassified Streptomyces TaxID=2593676 RepID=UPI0022AE58B2|nr:MULTISPECIES: siphovirus ReqiPepy6 Gp37-like family protein [unclassified Streptomyces]MCZ4097309.1 siphovirus ReqiPepy6 Gp37-like family protein [Streptomyces sp. H39-C1]MCZ4120613.1 siphovirus ReqiPepy6 Gp37-like family protein [Streptomyces sp. H39-S7]